MKQTSTDAIIAIVLGVVAVLALAFAFLAWKLFPSKVSLGWGHSDLYSCAHEIEDLSHPFCLPVLRDLPKMEGPDDAGFQIKAELVYSHPWHNTNGGGLADTEAEFIVRQGGDIREKSQLDIQKPLPSPNVSYRAEVSGCHFLMHACSPSVSSNRSREPFLAKPWFHSMLYPSSLN